MNHPKIATNPFLWIGAAVNLFIAWKFFSLWSNPGPDDGDAILGYATLMAFEFVMVHSGVFMAVFPRKWSLLLFFPFYGLFALAFNASMPDNTILWVYLFVVLGRMRFAFSDVTAEAKARLIVQSILMAIIYFVMTFMFAFGAGFVPELGVTPEFLQRIGYLDGSDMTGIFIETPQVALAFGSFYYVVITVVELWLSGKNMNAAKEMFAP